MALLMNLQKVSGQLVSRFAPQKLCVRYKFTNKVAIRRNKRRKNDMSWAAELLNYQKNVLKEQPEPEPLHLVTKIKSVYGRPAQERKTLMALGFTAKPDTKNAPKSVIVKNTPDINSQLMTIKHLVRITPITFPYGVPQGEEDLEHCLLNDNGEFLVVRDVTPRNEREMLPVVTKTESVWEMDVQTIQKHTEQIKNDWSLNEEFFTADPVYKLNQDGKEYRYFGDKSGAGIKHYNEVIDYSDGSKKKS